MAPRAPLKLNLQHHRLEPPKNALARCKRLLALIHIVIFLSLLLCPMGPAPAAAQPPSSSTTTTTSEHQNQTTTAHRQRRQQHERESLNDILGQLPQLTNTASSSNNNNSNNNNSPGAPKSFASLKQLLVDQRQQQQQHQQQQQQQQQQQLLLAATAAPNAISCDELSLVVLAQRVLNMELSTSAISRLIECQHRDLNSRKSHPRSSGDPEDEQQRRQQQQRVSKPTNDNNYRAPSSGGGGQSINVIPDDDLDQRQQQDAYFQLNLGAKISLTLLLATILLVGFATLFDFHSTSCQIDSNTCQQLAATAATVNSSNNNNYLRDYRSSSLSSSCSSSLYCSSTNSVASSSAPILTKQNKRQTMTNTKTAPQKTLLKTTATTTNNPSANYINIAPPPPGQPPTMRKQSASRLQELVEQLILAFSLRQSAKQIFRNTSSRSRLNNKESSLAQKVPSHLNPPTSCNGSATDSGHRHHQPQASLTSTSERHQHPDELLISANGGDQSSSDKLVQCQKCQNLSTFRLRFPNEPQSAGSLASSSSAAAASPSTQVFNNHNHHQQQQNQRESIDSLHGLRFLSMIWVIIIHSYNFALRWLFFTNTTTVEGIYKTLASQLLANGSFACDSFFFAGGFLLPYLAIPLIGGTCAPLDANPNNNKDQQDCCGNNNYHRHQCHHESMNHHNYNANEAEDEQSSQNFSLSAPMSYSSSSLSSSSASSGCSSPCLAEDSGTLGLLLIQFTCCTCFARFQAIPTSLSPSPPPTSANNSLEILRPQSWLSILQLANSGGGGGAAKNTNEQPVGDCFRLKIGSGSSGGVNHHKVGHVLPSMMMARAQDMSNKSPKQQGGDENTKIKSSLNTNDGYKDKLTKLATDGGGSRSGKPSKANDNNHNHNNNNNNNNKDNKDNKQVELLSFNQVLVNILHRYVRMMPLMMAIIGLSATLLRYLGDGPQWNESTLMYDKWCRSNWWINLLFLHNFVNRETMCLSHSWYSAVDLQLFLVGQLIMFILFKSRRIGLLVLAGCLFGSQLITGLLTLIHHLPAVPLIASVSEQTMNQYYGEIYIKPYCRASPYLIGLLLAYLMRTTSLGQLRLKKWQVNLGWTLALSLLAGILFIMQPAMNGHSPSELQSALYSSLSRPLWACANGWIVFACMTSQAGLIGSLLSAKCFIPFSRLTYPAYLIHPIVMAVFYGSRQSSFHFSHYLMLYLILGNIVITYACAFILAALVELPLLSIERTIKRQFFRPGK